MVKENSVPKHTSAGETQKSTHTVALLAATFNWLSVKQNERARQKGCRMHSEQARTHFRSGFSNAPVPAFQSDLSTPESKAVAPVS